MAQARKFKALIRIETLGDNKMLAAIPCRGSDEQMFILPLPPFRGLKSGMRLYAKINLDSDLPPDPDPNSWELPASQHVPTWDELVWGKKD